MPHPLAFTPVTGALLYFGARGPRRQAWVPVALLMASDLLLNKFVYAYPFTWDQIGKLDLVRSDAVGRHAYARSCESADGGRFGFGRFGFVLLFSNFASWVTWTDMYPRTLAGLMTCYAAGLPFFRRAVEGDLLFTCAMFATPVVLHSMARIFEKPGDHTAAV